MADNDLALLQRQVTQLENLWRDFRTFRRSWDLMIERRAKIALAPHLQVDGIDIQSPDLEFFLGQIIMIEQLQPTRVDAIALDPDKAAREDVEQCRLYDGYQWRRQNKNRKLDRARIEGQARYGLAVERIYWEMPGEPDTDTDAPAEKQLRQRNSKWADEDNDTFLVKSVHPLTVAFMPITEPEIFIEESVMNLIEARKLANDDGELVDMDEVGKLYFVGDKQPVSQWRDQTAFMAKRVHLITRSQLNRETGTWTICEYVYPGTGGDASNILQDQGVKLTEVEVPGRRCPYFIIPSGEHRILETDPHLAFRPRMYPLYVDMADWNYQSTTMAAIAHKFATQFYIPVTAANEGIWDILEGMGLAPEGQGAERRFVFKLSDPASNELDVLPKLERWPGEIPQAMILMRNDTKDSILRHAPSRFQTGTPSRAEVSDAKATTYADVTQSSSLPFAADIAYQDAGTVEIFEFMRAAIMFWGENPMLADKQYPFVTADGGEEVKAGFVTAKMMGRKQEIRVFTKNQTQSEEQIAGLQAAQDEQNGIITHEQHMAIRGADNIKQQKLLLEADQQEKDDAPHVRQMLQQTRLAIFMGLTGANQAALMGLPPPMPGGLAAPNPFPAAVEQTVPRSGTGPPLWKTESMAQEPPPPTGAGQVPQPGQGLAPSPTGFGAGSSPTGPVTPGR